MRTVVRTLLTAGLVLSAAAVVRADDQADLKALVDKAIKATGGEDKLAKYKAMSWKGKGTVHVMNMALPYTGDWTVQWPNQFKARIEADVAGNKFTFVIVSNGDKGWFKVNEMTEEMDKDRMAEHREERYASFLTRLLPLKDKDVTLAALGESKVNNRPALGIKVSKKGHRDVQLFFDKETFLLVKMETRIKDQGVGPEMTQETFYSDHKVVDGIQQPTKVVIKRDGNPYIEDESFEHKYMEKVDNSTFEKP